MARFRKSFADDVDAVTPIVSTLLLITIMLTIISSILYWSIPTMNRISWDTEYRTTMAGFEALDAALEDTVQGGVAGSTRTIRISVPDGTLLSRPRSSRWYLSYTYDNEFDFEIYGMDDEYDDPESISRLRIFIWPSVPFRLETTWVGDNTSLTELSDPLVTGDTVIPTVNGTQTPIMPRLEVSWLGDQRVSYVHFRLIHTNGTLLGEAHLIPMDRLEVMIPSEFGTARIISENGGMVAVYPTKSVVNPPLFMYDPDTDRINLNFVRLDTDIASVGQGNWRVNMRLQEQNYTRTDDVHNIRIRNFGEYDEEWHRYLLQKFDGLANTDKEALRTDDEQEGVHVIRDDGISLNLIRSNVLFNIEGI
jgi:hypothetical protein